MRCRVCMDHKLSCACWAGARLSLPRQPKKRKQQSEARLRAHHRNSVNTINLAWVADTKKIGGEIPRDVIVKSESRTAHRRLLR